MARMLLGLRGLAGMILALAMGCQTPNQGPGSSVVVPPPQFPTGDNPAAKSQPTLPAPIPPQTTDNKLRIGTPAAPKAASATPAKLRPFDPSAQAPAQNSLATMAPQKTAEWQPVQAVAPPAPQSTLAPVFAGSNPVAMTAPQMPQVNMPAAPNTGIPSAPSFPSATMPQAMNPASNFPSGNAPSAPNLSPTGSPTSIYPSATTP